MARIALEPAKKAAPEPPAPTHKATVKTPVGTVKKLPAAAEKPAVKRRLLTDKERVAAAKEKVRAAKEKEKERAAKLKLKEREQAKKAKEKEKEKEKQLKKAESTYFI